MHARISLIALMTSVGALASVAPAQAQDANAFADALMESLSASGMAVSYGSASADGDTITLSQVSLDTRAGTDPQLPGDLTFTGVSETGDGGYTAQTASIPDVDFTNDAGEEILNVTAQDILIENITIPADPVPGALDSTLFYEGASVGPVSVSIDGVEVMAMEAFSSQTDASEDFSMITSSYELAGLTIEAVALAQASEVEETRTQALDMLETLEVETLNGTLSGMSEWNTETGALVINDTTFDFQDLASLSFSMTLDGLTGDRVEALSKAQMKFASLDTVSRAQMEAFNQSMLESLEGVTLASARLHYEDDSLFMRAMELAAQEQGIDAQTMAQGLAFMVPMTLSGLQAPEFTAEVTEGLRAFLADPQSLTLAANPLEPIGMQEVENLSQSQPGALLDLLNVEVLANQ